MGGCPRGGGEGEEAEDPGGKEGKKGENRFEQQVELCRMGGRSRLRAGGLSTWVN